MEKLLIILGALVLSACQSTGLYSTNRSGVSRATASYPSEGTIDFLPVARKRDGTVWLMNRRDASEYCLTKSYRVPQLHEIVKYMERFGAKIVPAAGGQPNSSYELYDMVSSNVIPEDPRDNAIRSPAFYYSRADYKLTDPSLKDLEILSQSRIQANDPDRNIITFQTDDGSFAYRQARKDWNSSDLFAVMCAKGDIVDLRTDGSKVSN